MCEIKFNLFCNKGRMFEGSLIGQGWKLYSVQSGEVDCPSGGRVNVVAEVASGGQTTVSCGACGVRARVINTSVDVGRGNLGRSKGGGSLERVR